MSNTPPQPPHTPVPKRPAYVKRARIKVPPRPAHPNRGRVVVPPRPAHKLK